MTHDLLKIGHEHGKKTPIKIYIFLNIYHSYIRKKFKPNKRIYMLKK